MRCQVSFAWPLEGARRHSKLNHVTHSKHRDWLGWLVESALSIVIFFGGHKNAGGWDLGDDGRFASSGHEALTWGYSWPRSVVAVAAAVVSHVVGRRRKTVDDHPGILSVDLAPWRFLIYGPFLALRRAGEINFLPRRASLSSSLFPSDSRNIVVDFLVSRVQE